MEKISIFWFRRDLRLNDNRGFYEALKSGNKVLPLFIFDTDILSKLPRDDHRVSFIHQRLSVMNDELKKEGRALLVVHGRPLELIEKLTQEYEIASVYTNKDYEPYARKRDKALDKLLSDKGIAFQQYFDQTIFGYDEILKDDGSPYLVYTPYKNKWKQNFSEPKHTTSYKSEDLVKNLTPDIKTAFLDLDDIGFTQSKILAPDYTLNKELVDRYKEQRNFPAQEGTSYLGVYLRFGVLSIRDIVKKVLMSEDQTFLDELIWREFFMAIMWHFPYSEHRAFREKYDDIQWNNNEEDFEKWKQGITGFPLVDAGMRELNETGFMHNRVRMVVASFLCKDLLIDWRWGERYFAEKLFDYELSSNVGNWQWSAGTGVDAAPYFRIFNPESQMKSFDPQGIYLKKWLPEYFGIGYVSEMINHKEARERTLEAYKQALELHKSKEN